MALLQVSDLTFSYEGSGDNVFEDVSFSIDTSWKSPVRQKNQAKLVSKVLESLQGMSVIKSFNLTGKGDEALKKAIDDNRDSNMAMEKLFIPYARIQGTVLGIFKALLMLLAVAMFISGTVTMLRS